MIRRLWIWGPVVAQMTAIFVLSGIPNLGPLPADLSDKTGHLVGYGILGAVALRAFAGGRWAGVTGRAAVGAVLLAAAYGISDEFHQRFVSGRSAELADWVADVIGALAAALVGLAVARLRRRPRP